eukprot:9510344-Alexandrium_andersonii.AAC.1
MVAKAALRAATTRLVLPVAVRGRFVVALGAARGAAKKATCCCSQASSSTSPSLSLASHTVKW